MNKLLSLSLLMTCAIAIQAQEAPAAVPVPVVDDAAVAAPVQPVVPDVLAIPVDTSADTTLTEQATDEADAIKPLEKKKAPATDKLTTLEPEEKATDVQALETAKDLGVAETDITQASLPSTATPAIVEPAPATTAAPAPAPVAEPVKKPVEPEVENPQPEPGTPETTADITDLSLT